jgi:hypothetical protein
VIRVGCGYGVLTLKPILVFKEKEGHDLGRNEGKSGTTHDKALPLKPGCSCGRAREIGAKR